MKKLLIALLLVSLPLGASAAVTFPINGGSGNAGTLTGWLFGHGTSPYTASTSPFFSTFSFGTATGTSATTTNFFSTTASTTNLFGTNINGFGLSTCSGATDALTWAAGLFGCHAIAVAGTAVSTSSAETATYVPFWTTTAATPALLSGGDSGFTWNNTSKKLTVTNYGATTGTTTSATSTSFFATTASSTNLFSTNGTFNAATISSLTSGRVTFATTAGLLTDDADMTFSGDTLTATKLIGSTSLSTPSIITASGALGITPAAGSNLNVSLSTTGDFAVNTNQLYVDTSAAMVGIATTTPAYTLDVFGNLRVDPAGRLIHPYSSAPTLDTNGSIAVDSTSNQVKYQSGAATLVLGNGNQYPAFTYATSTAWTGTTTIPLGPAFVAETWNAVQCFTDTGTLNVSFYDGTNRMNMFNASTTVGTVGLTTNNTFTAAEKRYVDVGTPATSPTKISCTVSKSLTAD